MLFAIDLLLARLGTRRTKLSIFGTFMDQFPSLFYLLPRRQLSNSLPTVCQSFLRPQYQQVAVCQVTNFGGWGNDTNWFRHN